MTALYGSNYTKLTTTPTTKVGVREWGSRVRAMYDEYEFSAVLTDADTISFAKVPAGARVLGGWLKTTAMGTAGSFLVGKTGDTDALLGATDVSAASQTVFNGVDVGDPLTAETEYFITVTNHGSATSGTIQACVYYVVD
jgi:hypothetical protein